MLSSITIGLSGAVTLMQPDNIVTPNAASIREYYPGDSYTQCDYPFEVLACPAAAPWMKISDLIDYLEQVRPKRAFATHNAILNDNGHLLQNSRIREYVTKHGGEFSYLLPGESITI